VGALADVFGQYLVKPVAVEPHPERSPGNGAKRRIQARAQCFMVIPERILRGRRHRYSVVLSVAGQLRAAAEEPVS
jgi:hypothetical protein